MRKGFTLIELIIVIVISSMVSVFTFSFIFNSIQTYQLMRTQRQLHQEASYAIERITRDLRDASFIVTSGVDISFTKPARNALEAPNTVDRNPFVRYYTSGPDLYRCSDSAAGSVCLSSPSASTTNKIVARNIVTFTVTPNPNIACNLSSPATCQDDSFSITLGLTREGRALTIGTMVTPKNYCAGGVSAASCPSQDYTNRSFNGDYRELIN